MKKLIFIFFFTAFVSSSLLAATDKDVFDKGVTFLKNEQFQEAVDVFTELIAQAPDNPDAYKNRGVAYMKLEEYDLAIVDFDKTRQIKPDLKGLYSNLGVAWYYKGEYEKAIQNYNMEIALTPDNYYAFFNRAICRAELDELTKSLEDVNRAIALSPQFYLAHCLRGDLLGKMGKIPLAREAYERAMQINPDHAYAKDQLAALPSGEEAKESTASAGASSAKIVEKSINDTDATAPRKLAVPEPSPEQDVPKTAGTIEPKEGADAKNMAGSHAFELQAGAYQSEKNAVDMEQKLTAKGYPARIVEMDRPNGKHWYLVRTGGFDTRASAETARKEVMADLGSDIIVRPWGRF